MAHFISLPKLLSAKETAETILLHIFRLHGIPVGVVSDQGPQFTSIFFEGVLCLVGGLSQPFVWFSPAV